MKLIAESWRGARTIDEAVHNFVCILRAYKDAIRDGYVSIREASQSTHVSEPVLRQWCCGGRVPCYKRPATNAAGKQVEMWFISLEDAQMYSELSRKERRRL